MKLGRDIMQPVSRPCHRKTKPMNTPEQHQRMRAARAKLEEAMQEMVRISYEEDGVGNMYVQDWVLATASESMDPGHGNKTFLINFAREGIATYQIVGLLGSAKRRYENG